MEAVVCTNEDRAKVREQKEAYYNALVGSWVSTRNEVEQQLISISGIGVIVLITILAVQGMEDYLENIFYFCLILGFVATMISMIIVFNLNSRHLKDVLDKLLDPQCEEIEDRVEDSYEKLKQLDLFGLASFFLLCYRAWVLWGFICFRRS